MSALVGVNQGKCLRFRWRFVLHRMSCSVVHCIHCSTALHCNALRCTALQYCIALHCTAVYCIVFNYMASTAVLFQESSLAGSVGSH